ncbi:DeoR/GlpR family DNA-binding transcription regulator [Labrys wisconsinensis]|uniref:DeoR family glycerol-3-phosphate regulon repressor n=1 Tax=Labrys wisconsinensis TaxID=425677 RepID=A0ABU0JM84_9HYPH|nr:DeoR/GlpR family DNA-binding transcription regulator [Labrys wisconsinensis]MDQ0475405.1 DeoR family glycerol-3-phosphate regulon repressor [Labrys wisconsinensis]
MLAANDRQDDIVTLARAVGRVSVDDLAARFEVSPQTIRKDLNDLCEKRILTRVHGGAIIASSIENVSYEARKLIGAEEKRRIGRAAAALIPNKSSLFINIGTTTEEVAAGLHAHEGLLVITNNLNVATGLYRNPKIDVIVVGGPVRSDGAVIGSVAVDLIHKFKVDTAVIGASAIDEDGTLLDFDYEEVKVAQAIIQNARRVILVADRLKFERAAPIRIANLSEVDAFVTDRLPSEEMRALCQAHGVSVVETAVEGVGARRPLEDG